jgi:hypothetical protein
MIEKGGKKIKSQIATTITDAVGAEKAMFSSEEAMKLPFMDDYISRPWRTAMWDVKLANEMPKVIATACKEFCKEELRLASELRLAAEKTLSAYIEMANARQSEQDVDEEEDADELYLEPVTPELAERTDLRSSFLDNVNFPRSVWDDSSSSSPPPKPATEEAPKQQKKMKPKKVLDAESPGYPPAKKPAPKPTPPGAQAKTPDKKGKTKLRE